MNVVCYTGSLGSREVVQAHELWLQPDSMDGRSATTQSRENLPDRVRLATVLQAYGSFAMCGPIWTNFQTC